METLHETKDACKSAWVNPRPSTACWYGCSGEHHLLRLRQVGNIYTDNDEHNGGKGERNDVIRAGQGYGNYRLGNELNWWEAGLKATFGNKATRTLIPHFTLVVAKAGVTLA